MGDRTQLTVRVLNNLTFEWVHVDEIIDISVAFAPPGKALRVYQRNYELSESYRAQKAGPRKLVWEPDEDHKIRMGARMMVKESFNTVVRAGEAEIEKRDDGRYIRRIDRRKVNRAAPQPELAGNQYLLETRLAKAHPSGMSYEIDQKLEGLNYYSIHLDPSSRTMHLAFTWVDGSGAPVYEEMSLNDFMKAWVARAKEAKS